LEFATPIYRRQKVIFHFRLHGPPISNFGSRELRAMFAVTQLSRAWSIMWGLPLESRRHHFENYFQFRFGGRHLESVVNNVGDIKIVTFRSAVVEHMKLAVGIMFVCLLEAEVTSTSRKSSDFSMDGAHRFPGHFRDCEKAMFMRKTPKHLELGP